jgi:hypothetical protein
MDVETINTIQRINTTFSTLYYSILFNAWMYCPYIYIVYNMMFISLKLHICLFIITYYIDNIIFMIEHMGLHYNFCLCDSVKKAYEKLHSFAFLEYIHHYNNNPEISGLKLLSKNSLLMYFGNYNDIQLFNNFVICTTTIITTTYYETNIFIYSMFMSLMDSSRCKIWLISYTSLYYFSNNVKLCNLYTAYMLFMLLLQSVAHSWYHTHPKEKYNKFGYFLYNLGYNMEKVGIFNIKKHVLHHKHTKKTMNNVEYFTNMYMPFFIIKIFDIIWRNTYKSKYFLYYYNILIYTFVIQIIMINYKLAGWIESDL